MSALVAGLDTTLLRVPMSAPWAAHGVTRLEVVHVTVADDQGGTGTGFTFSISGGAAAVIQPDTPLMGGISECMRVAVLADAHGARLCPHFLPELHVHVVAAARAGGYVEHFPLLDPLLEETLEVAGGVVRPPDRAGHGLLWSPAALERHRVR